MLIARVMNYLIFLGRDVDWRAYGFSLLEMLLAVAVMAVLASMGWPSYQRHVAAHQRRLAWMQLAELGLRVERWGLEHASFAGISLPLLQAASVSASEQSVGTTHYHFQVQGVEQGQHYVLQAIPDAWQLQHDSACGRLSLDDLDDKKISGSGSLIACSH